MKIIRPVTVVSTGAFSRATTATYIDSAGARQTAAIDTPRFNYDPTNLASGPYLLLEAAATNLVPFSSTLASQTLLTTAGQYTLAIEGTGQVDLTGSATGTLTGSTGRQTLTFTATTGTLTLTVTGTVINAQLETGTKATSYIPTTGSSLTRAADVNTLALISNVPETDYSAWNSGTAYTKGNRVLDIASHQIYEALVGSSAVVGCTTASPTVVTWTAHGLPSGAIVRFSNSGGALPTGIAAATDYYVQNPTSGTFQISLTNGGALINVTGAGSGTNTATATNTNRAITDTTAWILVGSDNRWRMFDTSISSQTSQATSIIVALTPNARIDSLAGLNVAGATVTVKVVDPVDGLVYSGSLPLTSYSGIDDYYEYFYEPVVQLTEFLFGNLPFAYSAATITVAITATTPAIGGLVIGLAKEIGTTTEGAKVSIIDYGIKTKDTFGNYTVLQRGYSKRADFTIKVKTTEVDALENIFASYRSIPVVYVGSNASSNLQFQSAMIYGFYKDFSIDISYPPLSTCSLQVEGLT